MDWHRTQTARYALYGALFGFCFPLGATLMDVLLFHALPLSAQSVLHSKIEAGRLQLNVDEFDLGEMERQ